MMNNLVSHFGKLSFVCLLAVVTSLGFIFNDARGESKVYAQSKSATCVAPKLRQKMRYKQARRVILNSGFLAPSLPPYGFSANDEKVKTECFGSVEICNQYPEIESCSGQGYCRMGFRDAYKNELVVITYGPIEDPYVTEFGIECR